MKQSRKANRRKLGYFFAVRNGRFIRVEGEPSRSSIINAIRSMTKRRQRQIFDAVAGAAAQENP